VWKADRKKKREREKGERERENVRHLQGQEEK
jgi:hypothetical protein